MQSEMIRNFWPGRCLGRVAFLAALAVASEAGAEGLFPAPIFPAGRSPVSVIVVDLDGDTLLDLVTANFNFNRRTNEVNVLLGNGDGTFQAAASFRMSSFPLSIAVADLNGDTAPDLVTANWAYDEVAIFLNFRDPSVRPEIDIKPGSDLNSINPFARGRVPVVVLGSEDFEVADVDVTRLTFGIDGALPATVGRRHKDVNGDGFPDLLSYFRIVETGIEIGDTEACLSGETLGGTPFRGCDTIRTVPNR